MKENAPPGECKCKGNGTGLIEWCCKVNSRVEYKWSQRYVKNVLV